jgi:hypothetical protein
MTRRKCRFLISCRDKKTSQMDPAKLAPYRIVASCVPNKVAVTGGDEPNCRRRLCETATYPIRGAMSILLPARRRRFSRIKSSPEWGLNRNPSRKRVCCNGKSRHSCSKRTARMAKLMPTLPG